MITVKKVCQCRHQMVIIDNDNNIKTYIRSKPLSHSFTKFSGENRILQNGLRNGSFCLFIKVFSVHFFYFSCMKLDNQDYSKVFQIYLPLQKVLGLNITSNIFFSKFFLLDYVILDESWNFENSELLNIGFW